LPDLSTVGAINPQSSGQLDGQKSSHLGPYDRGSHGSPSARPVELQSIPRQGREGSDHAVAGVLGQMAAAARSSSKNVLSPGQAEDVVVPSDTNGDTKKLKLPEKQADQNDLSRFGKAIGFDTDDLLITPGPGQLAPVLSHELLTPGGAGSVHPSSSDSLSSYFPESLPTQHDLTDPTIEDFPTNKGDVLELIKTTSRKIEGDEEGETEEPLDNESPKLPVLRMKPLDTIKEGSENTSRASSPKTTAVNDRTASGLEA
jgi:hypothetical protein